MANECRTCKLPFRGFWSFLRPKRKTVVQFMDGVYCVVCASAFFRSQGHADVANEVLYYEKWLVDD